MGLQQTIAEKPIVGIAIAVVLLGATAVVWMRQSSGPSGAGVRYFYDLDSGDIVTFKADGEMPPVTLESGSSGVTAHLFSCGACGKDNFVAYLEMYTDAYKQAVMRHGSSDQPAGPLIPPRNGRLVAAVPDNGANPVWLEYESSQGLALIRAAAQRCDNDSRATECLPE
jgi:hypothetical protein